MSKTSGADPITREQVERLLVEVQSTTSLATAQVALGILGNGWLSVCPPYVAEFFDVRVTLPEAFRAALTRWRDELAAAEPVRGILTGEACDDCGAPCMYYSGGGGSVGCACGPPEPSGWRPPSDDAVREAEHCITAADYAASRAAAEPVRRVARQLHPGWYSLHPLYEHPNGTVTAEVDGQQAIAWGYEIEGGPEPVFTGRPTPGHAFVPGSAEHGHERQCAAPEPDGMRQCGYPEAAHEPIQPAEDSPERLRERREALGWTREEAATRAQRNSDGYILAVEGACMVAKPCPECGKTRARYAAALSAEEARRAKLAAERDAHAVPRLGWLEPERPVPRFKVGDWVRVVSNGAVYQVGEIATPFGGMAYYFRETGGAENSWQAAALEPASPPAPEVVDVPQPIVKRCLDAECEWSDEAADTVWVQVTSTDDSKRRVAGVPLALLRAMLEAIDAQQGGAS